VGNAQQAVIDLASLDVRLSPPPEAMRPGPRRTQPDGSITVIESWGEKRAEEPTPVVDRSPIRVTD
jgi:hypothetical protein